MAGLNNVTGIAGYQVQVNADSQATPEERMGGTADPRHSQIGEVAQPLQYYSHATQTGSHGPYGPENQMLGDETAWWMPGGEEWQDPTMDRTPLHHAAPYPKGVSSGRVPGVGPDDIGNQLEQSRWIHSVDNGAGLKAITGLPALQDQWTGIDEVNPGSTDLVALPKQAMSSGFMWGTRDRTQSMARQNEFGFDSKHMMRRFATGSIPGNTMWLRPGGRPLAKSLPGPARPPIGPDSPFAGQDLMTMNFGAEGAVLQNTPSEYAPPPQVNLAPAAYSPQNDAVVEWY